MKGWSDPYRLNFDGVDITKEPSWIEAPHIYKKNGWYYLMCAEGDVLSGSILTTDVAGGFTGNLIGLYATK